MCLDAFTGMKAQPCFQGPFSLPALIKYSDCYSCVSRNLGRAHVKNLWSLLTRRIRYKYFLAKSTYLVMHFVPLYSGFDDKFFMTSVMDVTFSQTFSARFMFLSVFAVPYFSILFVTFPHLSHRWFVIYFELNQ